MNRFRDYLCFAAWNSGIGYIALWAVTYWALDNGQAVFGKSGLCHVDESQVLFYWVCAPATPLAILASVVNTALTVTAWSPVFIAAATVRPDVIVIAAPIVLTHVIGLPTAIYVAMRVMLKVLQLPRRLIVGAQQSATAVAPHDHPDNHAAAARLTRAITRRPVIAGSRSSFGLRGTAHG
ncbi:MAG: hypothetical protein HY659_06485 [Rhizobiales bacterium]|nr:hypothetical protein [Hyphomicrobiales bacterium]